jgi:hypothetical protein
MKFVIGIFFVFDFNSFLENKKKEKRNTQSKKATKFQSKLGFWFIGAIECEWWLETERRSFRAEFDAKRYRRCGGANHSN